MKQNSSIQQIKDAALEAYRSLGNEIKFRAPKYWLENYTLLSYADEWNYKSEKTKAVFEEACPGAFPGFFAPSFVIINPFENSEQLKNSSSLDLTQRT